MDPDLVWMLFGFDMSVSVTIFIVRIQYILVRLLHQFRSVEVVSQSLDILAYIFSTLLSCSPFTWYTAQFQFT